MKKYEREELKSNIKNCLLELCTEIETNKKYTISFVFICVYLGTLAVLYYYKYNVIGILIFIFMLAIFVIIGMELANRIQFKEYYKSEYYKNLKKPALLTFFTSGNIGEYETSLKLREYDKNSKLLFDLYIPTNDGNTAQIDLIMINNFGIYIIESKNISGTIYGSEEDHYWTIVYNNNYKNKKYYNPIVQNKNHTNSIIKMFPNISYNLYEQYIVLSQRCEIGKMKINNKYIHVVKRDKLVENLILRKKELEDKLSDNEVNMIYNELLRYCNVPKKVKQHHDTYVSKFNSSK